MVTQLPKYVIAPTRLPVAFVASSYVLSGIEGNSSLARVCKML
jgi:hypothetical protein